MIPTREQMIEANQIMEKRKYARNLYIINAKKRGISAAVADFDFNNNNGEVFSRNQERVLRSGGLAMFPCLFKGNELIAWDTQTLPNKHGKRGKFWVVMSPYRKILKTAYVATGKYSKTQYHLGLCEKFALLPAIVQAQGDKNGTVFKVDEEEMEHNGFV